jgi:plasmid stabilization system protein ParE
VSGTQVEFTPEALREINEAFDQYFGESRRAAEAFVREVDRAVALIANLPAVWPHFEAGTRRYVLNKFPFSLIYREIPVGIEVVAVAHHKRRPQYWVCTGSGACVGTAEREQLPLARPPATCVTCNGSKLTGGASRPVQRRVGGNQGSYSRIWLWLHRADLLHYTADLPVALGDIES